MFYGEGVYDTLEMYTYNPLFFLPNSQLGFVLGNGPRVFPNNNEQLVPDVEVKMSSEDYLSGEDVVLEEILSN